MNGWVSNVGRALLSAYILFGILFAWAAAQPAHAQAEEQGRTIGGFRVSGRFLEQ